MPNLSRAKHLLRPLRFAVKDSFLNLPKMVGLGSLCTSLLQELSTEFEEGRGLAHEFSRFDQMPLEARRTLLAKTLRSVETFYGEPLTEIVEKAENGAKSRSEEEGTANRETPEKTEGLEGQSSFAIPPPSQAAEPKAPGWGQTSLTTPTEPPKPKKKELPPLKANEKVEALSGVGPQVATKLAAAGIKTVEDLLFLSPRRYVDLRGTISVSVTKTPTGLGKEATEGSITGQITASRMGFGKGGRRFEVDVTIPNEGSKVRAYYFRVNSGYAQKFIKGHWITLSGKMTMGSRGPQMVHPKTILHGENDPLIDNTSGSVDIIYSEIEGLASKTLAKLIRSAAERAATQVEDPLPEEIRREFGLLPLSEALLQVHVPTEELSAQEVRALQEGSHPARRRLAFDELFALQLGLALKSQKNQTEQALVVPVGKDPVIEGASYLPFSLTEAQKRSIREISLDVSRATPMNRMLVGEVGSGKTAVAFAAALPVLAAGMQAVLMAPTEILAVQHAERLLPYVRQAGHEIALITAGTSRAHKSSRGAAAAGMAGFVIGTHALLEETVSFRKLALVIIDEQHRFGVEQRARLMQKGDLRPHLLVMTATPIPRSLALTLYGDLELSVLNELPPGRSPIQTALFSFDEREALFEEIQKEVQSGGQVFVICPLIEESEGLDAPNAKDTAKELSEKFPSLKVGLLHGRLSPEERGQSMRSFARNVTQVLVATTVVEVGVDVPNASLMVILGAERFGLSQLHQLRGRVGRGQRPSRCLLWSSGPNEESSRRLRVLASCHDGFRLAEEDLRLRGPGEFLGTRQSGAPDMAMIDLFRDAEMLGRARSAARAIAAKDPNLSQKEHQRLRQMLQKRFGEWAEAWLS